MYIEKLVYDWITNDGDLSVDMVTDILEEKDDIEIALEIWDEMTTSHFTVDDICKEVEYFRNNRPDMDHTKPAYSY